MAVYPSKFESQDRLQPGARGEIFQVNQPGYRDGADRINRTNNKLATSAHDVPNCKWAFDFRLPVLFKYGFAFGYNQIVIPKGRVVAADPYMDLVDVDMKKQHNTITIANGGAPVRLRETTDNYKDSSGAVAALVGVDMQGKQVHNIGKDWAPIVGFAAAYEDVAYRPFKAVDDGAGKMVTNGPAKQLKDAGYTVDPQSGKVMKGGQATNVRPGNHPLGMLGRNEYTRDDDALNGIMPGPILTDALVELPWFAYKDKAEQNPWGSAYGGLFPGALVKSDENGRFVVSPLSFDSIVEEMTIAEYELERQQVIGQVYSIFQDLLPEGAAKWATWALEDRLNSLEFYPDVYRQNNRRGEDAVNNSPYGSTGDYPGYPFEKGFQNADLHMLASAGRLNNYDQRMNPQWQIENLGIPGLTDGYNAVVRDIPEFLAGNVHYAGGQDYIDLFFRTLDTNIEATSWQISINGEAYQNVVLDAELTVGGEKFIRVKYADEHQGIIVLEFTDKAKADAVLSALPNQMAAVKMKYQKRGLSGVPTWLDWDGAIGSVKILLQK